MKLLFAPPSPFSAKVRMAARRCGIALDEVVVDTQTEPEELTSVNPLGKIPALVLDDGRALFGSAVICDYLDRRSGNLIVPQSDEAWLAAKRMEALADGVTDAAVLTVYEVRYRPEEKRHEPWVERQWRKAVRGLKQLEADVGGVPHDPNVGHIALAAMTGWLELRFAGRWETDHPALKAWSDGFFEAFPDLAEIKPCI